MNSTPQANRKHIVIFGETNSGKSALFNAILGTKTAIVSHISGTTTDPVVKAMELLPYGPVVLIDTAGLNDKTNLGKTRMEKTRSLLDKTDFAIYTIDIKNFNEKDYEEFLEEFIKRNIPHVAVFTKKDVSDIDTLGKYCKKYTNTYIVSVNDPKTVDILKNKISDILTNTEEKDRELIEGLVPAGGVVIMVVPIDSEAPKGRLILPQVQFIRNCLDNNIRCNVTTEIYLKEALEQSQRVDLVVVDSQIFHIVNKIVPKEIPLTSFSLLMARQKGDIDALIKGSIAIKKLKDGDKVLISEVCTHSHGHDDIGQVKIPRALNSITGKNLEYGFSMGRDYPINVDEYSLVVHCGGCMITPREFGSRIDKAKDKNIPITNYGVVLAMCAGILDRSIEIFQ